MAPVSQLVLRLFVPTVSHPFLSLSVHLILKIRPWHWLIKDLVLIYFNIRRDYALLSLIDRVIHVLI